MLHSLGRQRFAVWLMTAFALLAALLAVVGNYGVLAYFTDHLLAALLNHAGHGGRVNPRGGCMLD